VQSEESGPLQVWHFKSQLRHELVEKFKYRFEQQLPIQIPLENKADNEQLLQLFNNGPLHERHELSQSEHELLEGFKI